MSMKTENKQIRVVKDMSYSVFVVVLFVSLPDDRLQLMLVISYVNSWKIHAYSHSKCTALLFTIENHLNKSNDKCF